MWKFTLALSALIPSLSAAGEWALKSSLIYDTATSPVLSFELSYQGTAERKVFESNLPWGVRDSLTVTAFTIEDVPRSFSGTMYPDDPTPTQIIVRRGQTLEGRVALTQRLTGDLTQTSAPIGVCWAYHARKLSPNSLDTFTGCVVVSSGRRAEK